MDATVPQPGRRWRLHGFAADALLALGVGALGLAEALERDLPAGDRAAVLAGVLLTSGPLAWRRRAPLAALSVVMASWVGASLLGSPDEELLGSFLALLIVLYSVAAHCPTHKALAGLGIAVVGALIDLLAAAPPTDLSNFGWGAILLLTPWWAGRVLRARLQRVAELTAQTVHLEHQRDQQTRAAVTRERTRIARELHDIIAHGVSTMVLQAGAAEQVLGQRADRAAETLGSIQAIGRQALVEISRLLGVLREGGHEVGLAVQPSSDDLATPTGQAPQPASTSRRVADGAAYDAVLALAVAALGLIERLTGFGGTTAGPRIVNVVGVLLLSVPLAWRRRAPLAVLSVVMASVAGQALLGGSPDDLLATVLAVLVTLYTVAAHRPRPEALVGLGIAAAAVVVASLAQGDPGQGGVPVAAIMLLAPWWWGRVVRARLQRVAELTAQTLRLERQRDRQAKAAIAHERARIARELHDVIAHGVSVMVLQAGAAEQVLARQPGRAAEALRSIQETGRHAMVEIGRLLEMLPDGGEAAERGPQPTVNDLDALVAQARRAGLAIGLAVEGSVRPLPAGVGLSAYRIVQEAITNARRHAGPAHVEVTIRYAPDKLELDVVDDGRGLPRAGADGGQGGFGLVGMRERVLLYGGSFHAGPRPGGGFAVHARLPTGAAK